jgi:hypothetical protein
MYTTCFNINKLHILSHFVSQWYSQHTCTISLSIIRSWSSNWGDLCFLWSRNRSFKCSKSKTTNGKVLNSKCHNVSSVFFCLKVKILSWFNHHVVNMWSVRTTKHEGELLASSYDHFYLLRMSVLWLTNLRVILCSARMFHLREFWGCSVQWYWKTVMNYG